MIDILKCAIDTSSAGRYNVEFNKVAKIHKYWSRKPFHLVESCIKRYSENGNTVLDPFCGSGSTGIGSILNNRHFIGYDLNPAAIFITDCTLNNGYNPLFFKEEIDKLKKDIKQSIMDLYKVNNNRFLLYSIIGKNEKNYNAVACNESFLNKQKVTVSEELLRKEYTIPAEVKYPDKPFPKKFYKDRFSYKGVSHVSDMFTKRNLYALAMLYNYIHNSNFKYKNLFILAFSNTVLHASKLKAENVRPLSVNNYWIPDDYIEENVIWRYLDRLENIMKAKEQIYKKANGHIPDDLYELRNKSSLNLEDIADNSIDYIITDPPYGDAIQYSELSYIWNCWLNMDYDNTDEVIINPVQNKGITEFQFQINVFFENAYRVLKNDSAFTLCFQNKEVKIWLEIIQNIKKCGFALEDIKIYDTFGSPYNKHWAKFSPKADLYVTFRKSKKTVSNSGTIQPEKIIDDIISSCDAASIDMNKGYDLFVASVIYEIFNGKQINDISKWTLKKIVGIYEQKLGTVKTRHNRSIQGELAFSFD
jgi:DNA modification methylase